MNKVKYKIIKKSDPSIEFKGYVSLRPWHLLENEMDWVDTKVFATKFEIPTQDVWFNNVEFEEVNLYERFGKMLSLPKRKDSQRYLDTIRGFWYGLNSSPTYENVRRSIGILLGAPYSLNDGIIREVRTDTNEVVVGSQVYKLDRIWFDRGLVKKIGQRVGALDLLVDIISIHDYKTNEPLLRSIFESTSNPYNVLRIWGTFVIVIPSLIGASSQELRDLFRLLNRSKNKETDFIVRFDASENEDAFEETEAYGYTNCHTHAIEDMTFDDYGAVINNDLDFQNISGQDYSEEYQFGSIHYLNQGYSLGQAKSLGGSLNKNDVRYISGGLIYRDKSTNIKRVLSNKETAFGLTTNYMRMGNQIGDYRPYEMLVVTDILGNPVSSYTKTWNGSNDVSIGGTPMDIDISKDDLRESMIVSQTGAIYSVDFGESWSTLTHSVSIANSISHQPGTNDWWVVGSNQNCEIFSNFTNAVAPGTISKSAPSGPVAGGDLTDIYWLTSNIGFAAIRNVPIFGNAFFFCKTVDGGVNWTPYLVGGGFQSGSSNITHYQGQKIFLNLGSSINVSDNGGDSWSFFNSVGNCYPPVGKVEKIITPDGIHLIIVGDKGATRVNTENFDGFEYVIPDTESLIDIKITAGKLVAAGATGKVFMSVDGGLNWYNKDVPAPLVNPMLGTNETNEVILIADGDDSYVWF